MLPGVAGQSEARAGDEILGSGVKGSGTVGGGVREQPGSQQLPKGLKMASSWGPRPLGVSRGFSLSFMLASILPASVSSTLNCCPRPNLSASDLRTAEFRVRGKTWVLRFRHQLVSLLGSVAFILVLTESPRC